MSETLTAVPSATHPVVGFLWSIVDPRRPHIATPITVDYDGVRWSLATNGFLMAMTRGEYGFDAASSQANIAYALDRQPTGAPLSLDLAHLRSLATPDVVPSFSDCDACKNTGEIECTACEGDGSMECECECGHAHEIDCASCNGKGYADCDCERGTYVEPPKREVYIGVGMFDLAVISRALPHIIGDTAEWRQDAPNTMGRLDIGDWRVIIMPLRQLDSNNPNTTHPRVQLAPPLPGDAHA